MRIKENELLHWVEHFYGYGSWEAPVWFVAFEESGGDLPEEVAARFNYFASVHPSVSEPTLCDMREMYAQVPLHLNGTKAHQYKTRYDYRFRDDAILNVIWKNLIVFSHAYNGLAMPDLLSYQKQVFTSPSLRHETLIKLYPLPAPHNHGWYYSWLDMPGSAFLKSRPAYQEHVFEQRFRNILEKVRLHRPQLVLMYGMESINTLKQSVQELFENTSFRMVKAVKQHMPQYHRADINGTTLLITTQIPALRHHRVETGFDWEAFGAAVRDSG